MNKSYIHRSDSNQDYDYIVILVFFAFKFYVMKTEYLKHEIGGELIVKTWNRWRINSSTQLKI